jgi:hypothetical protein
MPADKDFKRVVRARMHKTGESYTAARANLLKTAPATAPVPAAPQPDYARLAGLSDAAIKAKTGCTWERWVRALDRVSANAWPHSRIAGYIREKYHTPSWWTQTVTVGYERIKGLRAVGQRRTGVYAISKSRTFALPLARLYRAFADPRERRAWLPEAGLAMRSATRNKVVRLAWPDGTRVEARFQGKGPGKAVVQLEQGPFTDKAAADQLRLFWSGRLDALAERKSAGPVRRPLRVQRARLRQPA